jgi:hypothetical protein
VRRKVVINFYCEFIAVYQNRLINNLFSSLRFPASSSALPCHFLFQKLRYQHHNTPLSRFSNASSHSFPCPYPRLTKSKSNSQSSTLHREMASFNSHYNCTLLLTIHLFLCLLRNLVPSRHGVQHQRRTSMFVCGARQELIRRVRLSTLCNLHCFFSALGQHIHYPCLRKTLFQV